MVFKVIEKRKIIVILLLLIWFDIPRTSFSFLFGFTSELRLEGGFDWDVVRVNCPLAERAAVDDLGGASWVGAYVIDLVKSGLVEGRGKVGGSSLLVGEKVAGWVLLP